MKYSAEIMRRMSLPVFVLLNVAVLATVGAPGQISPVSSAKLNVAEATSEKGSPPIAKPRLPFCPSAGLSPALPLQNGTSHHKVVLSWDASSPSADKRGNAVGYCLYRSKKERDAQQWAEQYAKNGKATCDKCEQINSVAVADTRCMDDKVEDGATYYYVAVAINARGKSSSPSNEARARIPVEKQSGSLSLGSPVPRSCRGASEVK